MSIYSDFPMSLGLPELSLHDESKVHRFRHRWQHFLVDIEINGRPYWYTKKLSFTGLHIQARSLGWGLLESQAPFPGVLLTKQGLIHAGSLNNTFL